MVSAEFKLWYWYAGVSDRRFPYESVMNGRNCTVPPTYNVVSRGSARTCAGAPANTWYSNRRSCPFAETTTLPGPAAVLNCTHAAACPCASVITGKRLITKLGSSSGDTSTGPPVPKYTVAPEIGSRCESSSTTVSGGCSVAPTVSDAFPPWTRFSPERGPLGSLQPQQSATARPASAT